MTYLEWTTAIGPQSKYSDPSPTGKYMPARVDKQKTFTEARWKQPVQLLHASPLQEKPKLDSEG